VRLHRHRAVASIRAVRTPCHAAPRRYRCARRSHRITAWRAIFTPCLPLFRYRQAIEMRCPKLIETPCERIHQAHNAKGCAVLCWSACSSGSAYHFLATKQEEQRTATGTIIVSGSTDAALGAHLSFKHTRPKVGFPPIVLKKSDAMGTSAIFESTRPLRYQFIAIAPGITNHSFVRSSSSAFFNRNHPFRP
jgi:hypothetical protein